jgi:hypothetical protein
MTGDWIITSVDHTLNYLTPAEFAAGWRNEKPTDTN